MRKCLMLTLFLLLAPIGTTLAQEAQIDTGVAWLRVNQNEDGSWGDKPTSITTIFHATSVVAETLQYLKVSDTILSDAVGWIKDQEVVTTDHLSRKIEILANQGEEIAALVLLKQLLSYQQDDGGWGIGQDEPSNVLDTTLALRAIQTANYSDNTVIEKAVFYLLSQQNSDGEWGLGAESSIYLTSLTLLVLDNYRKTYNLISKLHDGATWLMNQQNPDGGFGREGSTIHETSLAYQALIRAQTTEDKTQTLLDALSYIENAQTEDGSWNNNAYETALALRALKNSIPDLAISSEDISFSPQVPIEGESVLITATIHNQGGTSVENVKVVISHLSLVIGEEVIPSIPAGGEEMAFFTWTAEAGTNEFEIVVDPENLIKERDEENNSVYFFLTTGTRPDLTLSSEDITFDPPNPQVGDPELIISANIYNKGESEANDFVVELTINGQPPIEENITTLLGGQVTDVQVKMLGPLPEGTYDIEVVVDPDDRITESDETNNTASNSITIGAGPATTKDKI